MAWNKCQGLKRNIKNNNKRLWGFLNKIKHVNVTTEDMEKF